MTTNNWSFLNDVRIIDMSRLLPGPMTTQLLADLGAEVIKIEEPKEGDTGRVLGKDMFARLNRNKKSLSINLKNDEGREIFRKLIADADCLVESFRPGVLAGMGLDPDTLAELNPRLIVCSLSGYGQTGPLRERPGHDIGYLGHTGVLALTTRRADGTPALPPVPIADLAGGALTSALSVLAALYERDRPNGTGTGRWIDVSMTDAALALAAPNLAEAASTNTDPQPGLGLLTGALPFYELYRCKDGGLVALAALEPPFQQAFLEVMGRPLPTSREEMAAFFATDTRDAWAARLSSACVTPVLSPLEALEAPVFIRRGRVVGQGRSRRVTPPFWGDMAFVSAPAPAAGTHTAEVLAEAGAPADLICEVCP